MGSAGLARAAVFGLAALVAACGKPASVQPQAGTPANVAWAYPGGGQDDGPAPAESTKVHLDGVKGDYTMAHLHDMFHPVDWRPADHPPAPDSVMAGRAPDARACGYCHLPDGAGRPENAVLAGLPARYIQAQVEAMRSGARAVAFPGWVPSSIMVETAKGVTPAEVATAADYFSKLTFTSHVKVVEAATIPAIEAKAFVYRPKAGGGTEALGQRIIETPDSFERFELRDSTVTFTAYVPPGSLAQGRALAGGDSRTPACKSCHGEGLRGGPLAPPIAGRSPTYLFRQLYSFSQGVRTDPDAALMKGVVAGLTPNEMIELAAYVASVR